jgi:hypothetical protein
MSKNIFGCLIGVIISITLLFFLFFYGVGFIVNFVFFPIKEYFSYDLLVLLILVGLILYLLAWILIVLGKVGVSRKENGDIHLSSPLILDIIKSVGIVLALFPLLVIFSTYSPNELSTFSKLSISIYITCFLYLIFIAFKRLIKDRNDKIIISDDEITIDIEFSDEKMNLKKTEITDVFKENDFSRDSEKKRKLIFKFKRTLENKETELQFVIEPTKSLNISRDLILKHLKEKGYKVS